MADRTCNRCWNADLGGVEKLEEKLPRGDRGNLTEPSRREWRGAAREKTLAICVFESLFQLL
jgi:hypothetical protein